MIPLSKAAQSSGINLRHLRSLCQAGRIPGAQFSGRMWFLPSGWAITPGMTKITDRNGFKAWSSLRRAVYNDDRIEEVEGGGCDEGRVFIHLAKGYWFGQYEGTSSRTVGSLAELKYALSLIEAKS